MGVLLVLDIACCLSLLGLGGMLGYLASRKPAATAFAPTGMVIPGRNEVALPRFAHPRMDLASGQVPANQRVDLECRRTRQESTEIKAAPSETASATLMFEPFDVRQRHVHTFRERLDLRYARESLGDLSDPVAGHAWSLRHPPAILAA